MNVLLLCVVSLIGVILGAEVKLCPNSELDKFCNGIQSDDFSTVSAFLGEWSDSPEIMNTGLCGGMSPLSLAAAMGHASILETLLMLDQVVDVNFNDGGSALMMAVSEGQNEIVELLLKVKDIDVNLVETSTGGSALQAAALLGHTDITRQLLLKEGVEVNRQSREGYSPLMMAARGGHVGVVKLLLQHDSVDMNLEDNIGDTALTAAATAGQHAIVSLILQSLKKVDINHQNNDRFTALMLSSLLGHTASADALIRKHANVNLKGKDDWTAILYAIAKGHTDIVKVLLTVSDLDLNSECVQGWTASTLATHLQHAEILELLEATETAF